MVFICISLMVRDVEQVFIYLLVIHKSSLAKHLFSSFAHKKKNNFIYFWLNWVFIALLRLPLVVASEGPSRLGARALVFAAPKLSSRGLWALECGTGSCGTQALLLCGMWNLPRPGTEPMSPALAGRFLSTTPLGKSLRYCFKTLNLKKKII